MQRIILALILLVVVVSPTAAINLAEDGRSSYVIALPVSPIPAETTAVKELQEHLQLMTGASFQIVSETDVPRNSKIILVGQTDATKRLLPKTEWAALGTDGIIIKTVGDKLILAGGRPRGSLYAVYTFLEDVLGVRWWSNTERFVPRKANLVVGKLDIKYVPKIIYREAHLKVAYSNPFAARMKLTGNFQSTPVEYGGHFKIIGWCHTFYQLLPPERYFKQHPEWYSLVDGKRRSEYAQLCLSNEEMRKELVKNALEMVRKNPEAGIISVSQNDCGGFCQCPECKASEEREGSPAGPLVDFVNKVADDINREFPDFLIETLAYAGSRNAPKYAKPGRNVLIRLCSIECPYGKPLTADDPRDKAFMDNLTKWSAISQKLYIWSYIASFGDYLYPNPTLSVYGPNIKTFAQNKTIGVFMQGDGFNYGTCFVRLRSWVIAHLLWNPDLDEKKLVKEYMDGYYGQASPYLIRYLRLVENAYAKGDGADWMTPGDVFEAQRLFNLAAKAVALNSVLTERVRRERLPVDYLWVTRYGKLKDYADKNHVKFIGPKDIVKAVDEFAAAADKYNVKYISENTSITASLKMWKLPFTNAKTPPELGDLSGKKYLDIQDTAFRLYGAELAGDPAASNGVCAVMPTVGNNWSVQIHSTEEMLGKWHCYAAVKIESDAENGAAFNIGMFSFLDSVGLMDRQLNISEFVKDKYKLLDLGVLEIKPNTYIWFGSLNNSDIVKSISVDRIFLVSE